MITLYDTLTWNVRVARDKAARRREFFIGAAWLLIALAILAFMLLATAGLCNENPRAGEDRRGPAADPPTLLISPDSEPASWVVGGRDRPIAGGAATAGHVNPVSTPAYQRGLVWTVTAYCPCRICCGPAARGITASGTRADHRLAAAPRHIPFGTRIDVPGYGRVEVEDRGGAIKGNRLDVLTWGVKYVAVTIDK
jgi:3D (Asp-Asp-Asp) domain-containing protein